MAVVEIEPVNNIYSYTGDCWFIAWANGEWCLQKVESQSNVIESPVKLFVQTDLTQSGKRELNLYVLDWEENLTSP